MKIEMLKLDEIIPYRKNPRVNDVAVEKVASSINEYGFRNPILLDQDNVIIAGHTRYRASKLLDLKEVPVIINTDLTDAQIKAFRIADNRTSEFAEWDTKLLLSEMDDLELEGFDLDLTGFDLLDIENMRLKDEKQDQKELEKNEDLPQQENLGVIQYNIIFNTEDEQITWHRFLKYLKDHYQNYETISERLIDFINNKVDL